MGRQKCYTTLSRTNDVPLFCARNSPLQPYTSLSNFKYIPFRNVYNLHLVSGWCTPYWCIPLPYDSRRCDLRLLTHCLVGYLREKGRLRRKPKRNLFPSIQCFSSALFESFRSNQFLPQCDSCHISIADFWDILSSSFT